MTKQEAIETIKLALSQVEWDYPLDYAVAFDIAISAMEKQDVPDICVGDMISRQNAIDAICKACSMEGDYHKCDGYPETSTWCDELVALRALPSAQPERKRGKWIPVTNGRGGHECSLCHSYAPSFQTGNEWLTDYCPNCGADMRGKIE